MTYHDTNVPQSKIVDEVTTKDVTYVGFAKIGCPTSEDCWRIMCIDETTDFMIIKWADGDGKYNNVWDDRASLTYI